MGLGQWMQRRQAANDLKKLMNLSPLDRTRVCVLCKISWMSLVQVFNLLDINAVDSLGQMADSPWKVSQARIQAARENAPDAQLMALSLWQTTARAASKDKDPQLIATAVAIWNLLRSAEADEEHSLAEMAREFAQECFDALSDLQRYG